MRQGFTLIQISILLLVASLVLVTMLPSSHTNLSSNNTTTIKLNNVLAALREYQANNGALPCPADASQGIGDTNYGIAAVGRGTTNNCGGGSPAADYTDPTNNIAIGMVPVRALGLSNDYALDGFGRHITYAVDTNATVCGWPTSSLPGQIAVLDNGTLNNTVAALVSHGADGHGAWIPLTGSVGSATRLNAGSTDTDQHTVNAHGLVSGGNYTFPANYASINSLVLSAEGINATFVKKVPTATFDDLVTYKSPLWNINALPPTAPQIVSITPPANGTYTSGQVLTFTLTYSAVVTVNTAGGTPYLALSAITGSVGTGNVAQAAYQSGSGTPTLTFSYTIVGSDSAPNGLTMAPSITLNGGTIQSGNFCPVTGFTAPNLSRVIIGGQYLAVSSNTSPYIYLYAFNNGTLTKLPAPATLPGGYANRLVFTKDNSQLFFADSDGNIYFYNVTSTGLVFNYSITPGYAEPWLALSPDGNYLAVAANYHSTNPFFLPYKKNGGTFSTTGVTNSTSLPFAGYWFSMDWTPDSSTVLYLDSASGNGYNNLYAISQSGGTFTTATTVNWSTCTGGCNSNTYNGDLSVHPSGSYFALAGLSGIQIYQLPLTTNPTLLKADQTGIYSYSVAFSPDGNYIAAESSWDPTPDPIYSFNPSTYVFTHLTISGASCYGNYTGLAKPAWTSDSMYIVMASDNAPGLCLFQRSGTGTSAVFTNLNLSNGLMPNGTAHGVAFTH